MNVFHFKILCLYLDTNINLDIEIYDFICTENDLAGYKSNF